MSIYDWANDTGIEWLRPTEDGYAIAKIDAAEAWMPTASVEREAESAAVAREAFPDEAGFAGMPEPPRDQRAFLFERDCEIVHEVALCEPEPTTEAEALTLLRAVRFAEERLSMLRKDTERFLADIMPKGTTEVDGFGPVTVSASPSFTGWEHDAIRSNVVRQIAMDEQAQGDLDLVERIVSRWLQFTGQPSRYSIPALKAIGLDPDEYAAVKFTPRVVIVKDRR